MVGQIHFLLQCTSRSLAALRLLAQAPARVRQLLDALSVPSTAVGPVVPVVRPTAPPVLALAVLLVLAQLLVQAVRALVQAPVRVRQLLDVPSAPSGVVGHLMTVFKW